LQEKKTPSTLQTFFFLCKKAHQTKSVCLSMMKNCQHQHKNKPQTQEKSQDAATSMEDAITDTVHASEVDTLRVCT
jgi:hypothetical protein